MPMVVRLAERGVQEGVYIQAANNLGHYGLYQRSLQGFKQEWEFWQGCTGRLEVLRIEASGTVKSCPVLPTAAYAVGNIRKTSLRRMIETVTHLDADATANSLVGVEHLRGFCNICEFANPCQGGSLLIF
jgi:radical SAM protein with 4Fe4S-binding SPASM domain